MRTLTLCLVLVAEIGCYDPNAQRSHVVREVEAAGSGDLTTYTAPGLRKWFGARPTLALRIAQECQPLAKRAQANWLMTAEGSACDAAASVALWAHARWTSDEKGY